MDKLDLVFRYNHIPFTLQYKMFVRILINWKLPLNNLAHFFFFLSFLSPSSAPCKEESIRQPGVDTSHLQALLWRQAPLTSAAVYIQYIYCVSTTHIYCTTMYLLYLACIYCQGPLTTPAIIHDSQSAARLRKCGVAPCVDTQQTRAYLARTEQGRNDVQIILISLNQLLYCHYSAIFLTEQLSIATCGDVTAVCGVEPECFNFDIETLFGEGAH